MFTDANDTAIPPPQTPHPHQSWDIMGYNKNGKTSNPGS